MGGVCCVWNGNNASKPKLVTFGLENAEVTNDDQARIDEVSSKVSPTRLKSDQATRTQARVQGEDEEVISQTRSKGSNGNKIIGKIDEELETDIDTLAAQASTCESPNDMDATATDRKASAKARPLKSIASDSSNMSLITTSYSPVSAIGHDVSSAKVIQMAVEGIPLTKHPLMTAWKLGRIVQAARELKRLEDTKPEEVRCFPASIIEQVRRIGQKFEESQSLLAIKISELPIHESNPKLKLEWGLQLSQGLVRAIYSVDRDLDVCRGIAALQEKDLDVGLKENIVDVLKLGLHKPNDAIWRVQTYTKAIGTRGDDIVVESMADALDEPIGSIWLSAYSPPKQDSKWSCETSHTPHSATSGTEHSSTPHSPLDSTSSVVQRPSGPQASAQVTASKTGGTVEESTNLGESRSMRKKPSMKAMLRKTKKLLTRKFTKKVFDRQGSSLSSLGEVFNGIHLPPPDKGHNRASHVFVVTKVTPLHPPGAARLLGFRQTSVVEAKIPAAVLSIINVMPSFMVKKLARNYLENAVNVHAKKISLPEIGERLKESERAPFYKQLRCHLLGEPPAPMDWSEDIEMLGSSSSCGWDVSIMSQDVPKPKYSPSLESPKEDDTHEHI